MKMILYHNRNCSKSRECLKILEKKKINFHIREYMKNPLSLEELITIVKNLSTNIDEIIRNKKKIDFNQISKKELCQFLFDNPKEIQRPIFFDGSTYTVCRPPERVLEIIK